MSAVERGKATVSEPCVAACDAVLDAGGALLELLPRAIYERAVSRHRRQAQRRLSPTATDAAVPLEPGLEGPLPDRSSGSRELTSDAHSVAAVAGLSADAGNVHDGGRWQRLLDVFMASERVLGPRPVITAMAVELPMMRAQRAVASAAARTDLLRAESRWAEFVSWLSDNVGDPRSGHRWIDRAAELAREAGDAPMAAYVLMRKSQQALEDGGDPRAAIDLAMLAQRERELPPLVRGLTAVREAESHAALRNSVACARKLAEAHELVERAPSAHDPWWNTMGTHCTHGYVQAYEGRCWLRLGEPRRAVRSLEQALSSWPGIHRAEEALQRVRLAAAYAANGDADAAAAESHRALELHRAAPSWRVMDDLGGLDRRLAEWPEVAEVRSFREALVAAR